MQCRRVGHEHINGEAHAGEAHPVEHLSGTEHVHVSRASKESQAQRGREDCERKAPPATHAVERNSHEQTGKDGHDVGGNEGGGSLLLPFEQ